MSYTRCKDIHKFGNKYLPSAYKTQVDFRSHFSGKKVRLMVREIRYLKLMKLIFECICKDEAELDVNLDLLTFVRGKKCYCN